MIDLRENNESSPICPHCSETLTEVCFQELRGMLGKRFIYFCAKCRKVLGVSHRKGFWMG
jgi:uncharacterized protein with PIN domain